MPKTILGVQLAPSQALATYLKGGWKGATVDRVVRIALPTGSAEERGLALSSAELPNVDTLITALPADAAFQRLVELPFSDRSKVEQAAPLEAEETLPLPLEDMVWDVHILQRASGHSRALLVAAPQQRVAQVLEETGLGGLQPHVVDVDPLALATVVRRSLPLERKALALDLGPRLCQAVLLGPGGPHSFHAFSAPTGDPDLLAEVARYVFRWNEAGFVPDTAYLSGDAVHEQDLAAWRDALGIPVELLPFPPEGLSIRSDGGIPWPEWAIPLGLALREGYARGSSQINLLRGPFAPSSETGPWKQRAIQAGVYLAVLLALWGVGVWSESAYKESQYRTLGDAVRRAFQEALPEVTNIVSEADQMRARVSELEDRAASLGSLLDRNVSPLRILLEISARLPKDLEVEFRDITVEEGRVRMDGITTGFDATERIKADLAGYPRFESVDIPDVRTASQPGKVVFKLVVTLGREG